MNTKEQLNLLIEDMHFLTPDKEQEKLITRFSSLEYKTKFYKRFIISLVTALIILVAEVIARKYTNRHAYSRFFHYADSESIPSMIIFVISVFIIFNVLSFLFMWVKIQMNDVVNKYQCAYGIVTDKYDGRHLSQKSGEACRNYILFSNEEGHCTTALSVKNIQTFQSIHVGDEILVIKYNPLGISGYTFIPLAEKTEASK